MEGSVANIKCRISIQKNINLVLDKIGKLASLFLLSLAIAVTNTFTLEVRGVEAKLNLFLFPIKSTYLSQGTNWNKNRLSCYVVRWHKEGEKPSTIFQA